MKKVSYVVPDIYKNNRIFDRNDPVLNFDDIGLPLIRLKEGLKSNGIDLATQDINSVRESDLVIFNNMPDTNDLNLRFSIANKKKIYLLVNELGLIHKGNNNVLRHKYFAKIFTYQDDFIDNMKYFKVNYTFDISKTIPKDFDNKEKLCVLIAGNKALNHPLELYSKRVEVIRWFEKYHPNDFDLYGTGWDRPYFFQKFKATRFLSRQLLSRKIFKNPFPSYRGKVGKKYDVLKKYRFSICYENARGVPGWITEKMFHCFFAGCVPVYLGAPNVTDHIPANTFIDKENFKTYEELYKYLSNMPEREYYSYLDNIEAFIKSDRIYPFSIECFTDTLINEILKDI